MAAPAWGVQSTARRSRSGVAFGVKIGQGGFIRRIRSVPTALVLVLASLTLVACVRDATSPPTPAPMLAAGAERGLTGTVWTWTGSLFNDGTRWTPADPNGYHIEFTPQSTVAVRADCNRAAGTYTTEDRRLTITLGPSTLAACPPGSLDNEYVRQLGMVTSYFFHGGNLVLEFKFDSGSMTFAPSAPAGLARTTWKVVNYNNGNQAVVSLATCTEVTVSFDAGGRVTGHAGCNTYTGSFESGNGTLRVGALASTPKRCSIPPGVMDQERKFLAALRNAATYKIEGNMLWIRDAGDAMQVIATH
jgi:heat shock protein HslJ